MKIIINSSSMVPIYEQIVDQVKAQIISGELKEDDNLPSVRTLSKELRISALTVKKAYDSLEQEGFTVTIHGKGTYVAAANKEMMMEEYRREVEEELTEVIRKAKRYGLSEEDIREMLELILEGEHMMKLEQVKKQYKNFTLDCSLEVRPGCITGLIGQNGAGKSTTFKAALGLIHTDGGNIEMLGKPERELKESDRQQLGVVLSDAGFSEYLQVKDVIAVMKSMYPNFEKDCFISRCEQFQIPLDKKIKEFSTGMKAKLKVLLALSHDAKFLIMDEPTAGLDVAAREDVLDLLREYMEEKEERAILISSHISSDLEGLCDDLYMIHNGKIVLHEETDVLLGEYAVLKVDEEQYQTLDKQYILSRKKEAFGYQLLTNQKQFYLENYPKVVVENGTIDEAILMMIKGESV